MKTLHQHLDTGDESKYVRKRNNGELKKKNSWLGNILISIDQFGNAIARGNPDNTISARIGRFKIHTFGKERRFWRILEQVVDSTFYPIDGLYHCYCAYMNDKDEEFNRGNIISKIVLFILTVASCIPLWIVIRIIAFVNPKVKAVHYKDGDIMTREEVSQMKKEF